MLMGIAAFLVWRTGLANWQVRGALIMYLIQLVLNVLWSVVFFGLRSPLYGVVVIILLWLAILLTILSFRKVSRAAALLLVPYLAWVIFAGALNIAVWLLNP